MAVNVPSVEMLKKTMYNKDKFLMVDVGITFCSPQDQYTKAIGRNEALWHIKNVTCNLIQAYFDGGDTYFTLFCPTLNKHIMLKTRDGKPQAHLVKAFELPKSDEFFDFI